jgi:hypothetical protein
VSPSSPKTILSEGQITPSDRLVIELIESIETPPVVLLHWPAAPSVADPLRFPAVANAIMTILAGAIARLSQIRPGEL